MDKEIKTNNNYLKEFTKGILKENPVFSILLGLCPTLAITTKVSNGIGMGIAATFVLLCSNILISLLKDFIPDKIRIPSYIVIIASFVTIVDLVIKAFLPPLAESLGVFIPLLVVNCIILGRAESFANKNNVKNSIFDALGMGVGFTFAITLISFIREMLGTCAIDFTQYNGPKFFSLDGKIFINFMNNKYEIYSGSNIFISPAGAFIVVGLILAGLNVIKNYYHKIKSKGKKI